MDGIQQLFVVSVVLISFGAALWTLRRRGWIRFGGMPLMSRAARQLQLVERLQLTPQHAVCLVRLDNRTLLIGTAPSSCQLLDQRQLDSKAEL